MAGRSLPPVRRCAVSTTPAESPDDDAFLMRTGIGALAARIPTNCSRSMR